MRCDAMRCGSNETSPRELTLVIMVEDRLEIGPDAPQHQIHARASVFETVVPAPAVLYFPFQEARRQRLQGALVGKPAGVGEGHGRVDDGVMDDLQGPEVVLEPVPDQYRVRVDEPHQIVLHLAQHLHLAAEVPRGDPRKATVVVDDLVLRPHERVVHEPPVHADDRHLGQLQPADRVAHLAVEGVHAEVPVRRRRPPHPRLHVRVVGAVETHVEPVPDVHLPLGATPRVPLLLAAAVLRVRRVRRRGGFELAPVVDAGIPRDVPVLVYQELVAATHARLRVVTRREHQIVFGVVLGTGESRLALGMYVEVRRNSRFLLIVVTRSEVRGVRAPFGAIAGALLGVGRVPRTVAAAGVRLETLMQQGIKFLGVNVELGAPAAATAAAFRIPDVRKVGLAAVRRPVPAPGKLQRALENYGPAGMVTALDGVREGEKLFGAENVRAQ